MKKLILIQAKLLMLKNIFGTKIKTKKMRINCISTGSSGNLYELLDSKGNSIILEAGEPESIYIGKRYTPEMA